MWKSVRERVWPAHFRRIWQSHTHLTARKHTVGTSRYKCLLVCPENNFINKCPLFILRWNRFLSRLHLSLWVPPSERKRVHPKQMEETQVTWANQRRGRGKQEGRERKIAKIVRRHRWWHHYFLSRCEANASRPYNQIRTICKQKIRESVSRVPRKTFVIFVSQQLVCFHQWGAKKIRPQLREGNSGGKKIISSSSQFPSLLQGYCVEGALLYSEGYSLFEKAYLIKLPKRVFQNSWGAFKWIKDVTVSIFSRGTIS